MKIFSVNGNFWKQQVEVDDSIFEKYSDMATEAATVALESYLDSTNKSELGWFVVVAEQGHEDDSNKIIIILMEHILRNAGRHDLAEKLATKIREDLKRVSVENKIK